MKINPEKLMLSKWRAVSPQNKEKHFIVIDIKRDEDLRITHCVIESVLKKRQQEIPWQELSNTNAWKPGWN